MFVAVSDGVIPVPVTPFAWKGISNFFFFCFFSIEDSLDHCSSATFLENVAAKLLLVAGLRYVCGALPRPVVSWNRFLQLLGQRGRGAAALRSLI